MSNTNIIEEYVLTYNAVMSTLQNDIKNNEIAIEVSTDGSIPHKILDSIKNLTDILKSKYENYQTNHNQIMYDPTTNHNQALMKRFVDNSKKLINDFNKMNVKSSL